MSVPGSNLLLQALNMLGKHEVVLYRATGRVETPDGLYITNYDDGVPIATGQVQTVPRNRYMQLGYDANRDYVTWFVPKVDVHEVRRGESGDQFAWNGDRFQVQDNDDWSAIDGWMAVVGVKVGEA